jgi:hypothetical protein
MIGWTSSFLIEDLKNNPINPCMISITKEYLGLEGGPPWSHKSDHNSNTIFAFYLSNKTMGKKL